MSAFTMCCGSKPGPTAISLEKLRNGQDVARPAAISAFARTAASFPKIILYVGFHRKERGNQAKRNTGKRGNHQRENQNDWVNPNRVQPRQIVRNKRTERPHS